MKQTMQMVLAQPATVWPSIAATIAQITPMKLMQLTSTPKPVIMRMGFTERLVMPSKARASFFFRG